MKGSAWVAGLALISSVAVANEAKEYTYGMPLDVAQVVSITSPQGCAVAQATMIYLDSQGERHTLIYSTTGTDCIY